MRPFTLITLSGKNNILFTKNESDTEKDDVL